MSGDVQPRKRKDKKKAKRDSLDRRSEGDIFTRKQSLKDDEEVKESHHGVHAEKLGKDDVLLHVQGDHETGGHWCAKLFFFSLMAILVGIVGLIILENRGSSDVDTPLSESRFSEYFEGWVDEHRQAHDDHHSPSPGLDDHDGEPFEEEEDHSEAADEDHDVADDHDEDDGDDQEDEAVGGDDNEDENEETVDESNADENEDDDDVEPEVDRVEMSSQNARNKREVEIDDNDEGFEEGGDDNDDVDEENDDSAPIDDENNPDEEDDDDAPFEESSTNKAVIPDDIEKQAEKEVNVPEEPKTVGNEIEKKAPEELKDNVPKDIKPKKEEIVNNERIQNGKDDDDFDDADESLEKVIDNDAGEELHLRRKAEQEELAARAAAAVEEESESAPLAVKIAVGLALAFVARLVLVKKTQPSKPDEPIEGSPFVKRRFTMISAEDDIPVENEELLDDELDEEYSEEEADEDEEEEEDDPELQYPEDVEEEADNDNARVEKYVPETFEQLHAMYRSNLPDPVNPTGNQKLKETKTPTQVVPAPKESPPPVAKEEPKKVIFEEIPKVNLSQSTAIPKIQQRESVSQSVHKADLEYDDDEDVDEDVVGEEDEMELDDEEIYSGSEDDADEEVSDVDDDDLMRRLEEKYGKLPDRKYDSEEEDLDEQSWTKVRGPQTYLDDDSYIDEEIRRANEELFNDNLKSALHIYETLTFKFPEHPGALNGKAKVLDRLSTKYHSNEFLNEAIKAYQAVMNLGDKVNDEIFREAGEKCLERMRFRGMLAQAVPIHRKMIRRFSDDPAVRNQLAVTYLLQNRYEEAKYILHHTLMRWRGDGFAQAHYGFILKVHNNDLKAAVSLLREGIASGANGTQDGRFYFALGDALTRLGETKEALEVYQKGADLKLFPSVYQRSLYNIDGLKAQPFWTPEESTYEKEFSILQHNWELIQKEGLTALNVQGLYMDEAESLRDKGDWKQLELFARGYRIEKNCAKTPLTCNMIETFPAARMCKRGQVKFSIIHPGTHVWPHCGPTNCRLRGHLGLVVPSGTKLRVAKEERTWKAGEWLIFDDSFEHEVWHNGTSPRLVLIVDVWHPELTETQRDSLSRI